MTSGECESRWNRETKVTWKDGRLQDATQDAALASLCQAVEKAVRQHQAAGVRGDPDDGSTARRSRNRR